MKITTFTLIAGSKQCNARCPFCVAKMTPAMGITNKAERIDFRNMDKAIMYAKNSGVSTALITGKGEPFLHYDHIAHYAKKLHGEFPFIEIQTNGICLHDWDPEDESNPINLEELWGDGVTTIAVTICHYEDAANSMFMRPGKPYSIKKIVDVIHDNYMNVRLTCALLKGGIETRSQFEGLVTMCQLWGVEQLTIWRPGLPDSPLNKPVADWVRNNQPGQYGEILTLLEGDAVKLLELPHGAVVYDYKGQNVCVNNCLTKPRDDTIRQLIFFPDGHLRYDWQHEGAIIL